MTWTTALRLGRVSNLPTVWTNALVGAVLADAALPSLRLAVVLVSVSLFYVGGMYLNDAFDADIDELERPDRPIASRQVSVSQVLVCGYTMLAVAVLTLVLAASPSTRTATAGAAAALATAILGYNTNHKANPFAPVVMASCRALVYLAVASALGASLVDLLASPQLGLVASGIIGYVAGLTYAAAGENTGTVAKPWPLMSLAIAPLCLAVLARGDLAALGLLAVLVAWMGYSLALLSRANRSVGAAVVRLIAGISLFDAVAIAALGQPWLAMIAAAAVPTTRLLQSRIPAS